MKLPKLAIENHQFTMIVVCLLVLLGIVSFFRMPKSEDPQIQGVGSTIFAVYPGASPGDIEELIANPIESALNELENVRTIQSDSEDGIGRIGIEFELGSDPDDKYSEVVQKVAGLRSELPENLLMLETLKWTVTDVYIVQLALISETATYKEMENEADELKKRLEKVHGIKQVEIWALPQHEIRVSLDFNKLAQMRLPINRVMGAIMDANANIPGGHVDIGPKRLSIKTTGSYQTLQDIENTVVNAMNNKVVYLKDVADVQMTTEDSDYLARFNGRRAIYITANQKKGTNIFSIFSRMRPIISEFKKELPPSMQMEYAFDQSKSVSHRVNGFFMNLIQGIVLVGIVIFAAVSSRASLIVMLAIPTSILMGIGLLDLSHYGLQQMSIAGLVIALGLLVDNAIVVTENSARFMKLGFSRSEAAVAGTSQVGWAVVSATATTLLAFIPIILMGDMTGKFIRSMPLTVVYTLSASLLISLTLTPYLAKKFLHVDKKAHDRPFRKLLNRFIETRYRRGLKWALANPWKVVGIGIGGFLFVMILFFLFMDFSLFPKAEKPQFFVTVKMPAGTSLDKTDHVVRDVEAILHEIPEVKNVTANIGHGNPRIYYNVIVTRHKSYFAHILVELNHYNRKRMADIVRYLRGRFSEYAGAIIEVNELEQGPPVEAPIEMRIQGNNLDVLKKIAGDVETIMKNQPGLVNIHNPISTSKNDIYVRVNRNKAAMLGVSLAEIDRTIRAALTGLPVTQYMDSEGKKYDIVVRLPLNGSPRISDFERIYVSSMTGRLIPLEQLAALEISPSPQVISHYNLDRNVSVTADVEAGISVNQATGQVVQQLEKYQWPKGYRYNIGGESESREESFGGMGQAVVIAIVAIFGVLVLQFRSYLQPLIVFSAIPLAIIGSFLALFLTGNSFSFVAFIGLCSLIGIVVNNSIILVDYTNQLRREGKAVVPALKEAGETRFIPIVLTTLTTIGGLLPLTLTGGSLWEPMGWTIIGGLLTSTALTLIYVPVLYKLYAREN